MDYIDRIKDLRMARGITQVDLSKALGLSKSAYGLYETRRRNMDMETFLKICEYFGFAPNDLIGKKKTI